jgi:hypothetical protein
MGKPLILSTSLRGFFFEGLNDLNKRSLCPVPDAIIYYTSDVLDKFALSESFFDISEGKVRHKVLGMKILEASQLSRDEQRKVYKEVADMSLLTCGYFSESVNKKIVDKSYYSQLGKMAYSQLNNVSPSFLDIPSFYQMFATCFEPMTTLLMLLASKDRQYERALHGELSDSDLLTSGITPVTSLKVS